MKKLTSILLALILALGILLAVPFGASAAFGDGATPITLNTQVTAVVSAGSLAYFSFTPAESGLYSFASKATTDEDFDPIGHIYNASGTRLASHDDVDYWGDDYNFNVVFILEAGKKYFFGAGLYYNVSGSYPVLLTKTGCDSLSLNTKTNVYIENEDDVVFFSFTPAKKGTYRLYSDTPKNSYIDPYVTLYDAVGNRLGYDDDGGNNWNFSLRYNMDAGKTYYFAVSADDDGVSFPIYLEEYNPTLLNRAINFISTVLNWLRNFFKLGGGLLRLPFFGF